MRSVILSIALAISSIIVAQTPPTWTDASYRNQKYPKDYYVTGYSISNVDKSESVENAMKRVENTARVNAVSVIQVQIESETVSKMISIKEKTDGDTKNEMNRYLTSETKSQVSMEISGLKVETYFDVATNRVSAFAYVKISDLIRQTDRKISSTLARLETGMDEMDQLIDNGQKMEAKKKGGTLTSLFQVVEQQQNILIAVDQFSDEEGIQMPQTIALQKRYINLMTQLRNGINIYLSCKADMLGQTYGSMANEIKGELSKLGCSFVSKAEDADWAVYVTAKAREYNAAKYGEYTTYFTYTGATIAIDKIVTGQRIYENSLPEEKGGHTQSFVEAARSGYKAITPKVIYIIKENIQQ